MDDLARAKLNQQRAQKATGRARRGQDDAWLVWVEKTKDFQKSLSLLTDADTKVREEEAKVRAIEAETR